MKPEEVISFLDENESVWWTKSVERDDLIRERFSECRLAAIRGDLDSWKDTSRGRFALILLIDQFSRNMFRGSDESFAHDSLAQSWTKEGIELGQDKELELKHRWFFYMPLMHSEKLEDQELSCELFQKMIDEAPEEKKESYRNGHGFAVRHRDIVARFGRFPHRNQDLGRESTPEEIEFLKQPGSSF